MRTTKGIIVGVFLFILCLSTELLAFVDEEMSIANLFSQQSDTIVLIGTVDKKGSRLGSGFIVSPDGLILTNYHLVGDAQKILVKLKNKKVYRNASFVKADIGKDIALIKITASGLKAVRLGNSDTSEIGQRVVTIGNPLGFEYTVADGLVSSWRDVRKNFKVLQISVPLSQGSSGAPLFNLKGQVIGIATATTSEGQNLNFAVPINYAKPLLGFREENILNKERPMVKVAHSSKTKAVSLKSKASSKKNKFKRYVIKPKDTLFCLAKRYNTTVAQIKGINNISGSRVYAGQLIKIPTAR